MSESERYQSKSIIRDIKYKCILMAPDICNIENYKYRKSIM